MTIYNSFDEVPNPDDLDPSQDEVHTGGRKWKWDGTKWTLYAEGTVGGINFEAEIPIYRDLQPVNDDDVNVTHYFDMKDLKPLT